MNSYKLHIKIIIVLIVGLLPGVASAQVATPSDYMPQAYSPVGRQINQDLQNDKINVDDAYLYQFYSVFDPSKLPDRYMHLEGTQSEPLKCFTPTVVDYQLHRNSLTKNTQNIINDYLADAGSGDNQSYTSPSGKFRLLYTTDSGNPDAVPTEDDNSNGVPDYVEWAGQYADSVYNVEVKMMGFSDPIPAPYPFTIVFARLGSDNSPTYGYTYTNRWGNPEIKVHCDFALSGFPSNTDPDGKVKGDLKVTIAHEFKHAIQYVDNGWSGESSKWLEMDAVMMEEAVFDTVNDYYNYLKTSGSIFSNPQYSIYPGSYNQVSWAIYYLQKYGIQFWREVWAHISQTNDTYVNSMSYVLEHDYQTTFKKTFVESELWHYASGSRSPNNYGFEERANYPTSHVIRRFSSVPNGLSLRLYSNRLSAIYQEVDPSSSDNGPVYVSLFPSNSNMDLGLVATFKDGSTQEIIKTALADSGDIYVRTPWNWEDIKNLGIVSANSSTSCSSFSRILVGANQVVYGDYDEDGNLDQYDVRNILSNVSINGGTYDDQLLASDLSEDGTVSAYDASLIMRHLDGTRQYFKKDTNHDGYGPELDNFDGVDQGITQPPTISSTEHVSLQLEKGDTSDINDNPVKLNLINHGNHYVSSYVIRLAIPQDAIKSISYDTTGSVLHDAEFQTYYDNNVFNIVVAEADSFLTGNLGTLHINASQETDVTISFADVRLNEYKGDIGENSLDYHLVPKTTVAIDQPVNTNPKKTGLLQNYPNPFNPTTNIGYSLQDKGSVTLEIYNILGQRVAQLVNAVQPAGTYRYNWDASSYTSGTYVYRLIVRSSNGASYVQSKKMLLIK